jgi:alpha-glucosidase
MALPGGVYVYQGEELGLWEVEDLADELRQDPVWIRSGHTDRGRDGCRVPIPWADSEPPFGFSPGDASIPPWLPQPAAWRAHTAAAQSGDPDSMLTLYRQALSLRRSEAALGDGGMRWLDLGSEGVLAFARDPGFGCVSNLSETPIQLPAHDGVLLSSGPLNDNQLPTDTTVWLRLS